MTYRGAAVLALQWSSDGSMPGCTDIRRAGEQPGAQQRGKNMEEGGREGEAQGRGDPVEKGQGKTASDD